MVSKEEIMNDLAINRRKLLKATATSVIGTTGLGQIATANVETTGGDVMWSFDTNDWIGSSPTVVNGSVFIGSGDGYLYKLNAETGDSQWEFDTGAEIGESSPNVVDGKVVIGNREGKVYAISTETGNEDWMFDVEAEEARNAAIEASPTIKDDLVYIGSWDNNIYALEVTTGEEVWRFETGDNVWSSPTIINNRLFAGSNDGRLYALDSQSGNELWNFEVNSSIYSPPTVSDERVFFGANNSQIYALSEETGEQEWVIEAEAPIQSAPTVWEGVLYVWYGTSDGNKILAIDVETGNEQWSVEYDGPHGSSLTVANGTVFGGYGNIGETGVVYALDADTGDEKWSVEYNNSISSSPTVVDGIVFVGGNNGSVYALDAGVNGSSEGSRVDLGTLGHHHEWANEQMSTIDIQERKEEESVPEPEEEASVPTVIFSQASQAANNPLTIIGAGVVATGLGYLGYKKVGRGKESESTPQEASDTSSKITPTDSHGSSTDIFSVGTYSDMSMKDIVKNVEDAHITHATTQGRDVWVITPDHDEDTIRTDQFDAFLDRIDPWVTIDEHPHIRSVYGHGSTPVPWVAVEPTVGSSFQEEDADLTTEEILELLEQVSESLHHVHRYGITYENLSSESVSIEDGIATLQGVVDHVTIERNGYALPNPNEDPMTEQADMYRLGSLTYEALTGSQPEHPDPKPPSKQNSSLPSMLDEVLLKALASDPDDRHETALHFRDELQKIAV